MTSSSCSVNLDAPFVVGLIISHGAGRSSSQINAFGRGQILTHNPGCVLSRVHVPLGCRRGVFVAIVLFGIVASYLDYQR